MSTGLETFKKQLKKYAEELTPEGLMSWKTTYWSHLIAVAAGLSPFEEPATKIIPPAFRVFLPKDKFTPTAEDRLNAVSALCNALNYINSAIIETTRQAYMNFSAFGGAQLPIDFDTVVTELLTDLNQYEKRKMYFQAGMAMMPEEEAWIGKHHIFAIGVINWYDSDEEKVLTETEFLNIARDLDVLDGQDAVSFNPLAPKKAEVSAPNFLADIVSSVGNALQQNPENPEKS